MQEVINFTRPNPFQKMVGNCLETPFVAYFCPYLQGSKSQGWLIMSTYLGGLIHQFSDLGVCSKGNGESVHVTFAAFPCSTIFFAVAQL